MEDISDSLECNEYEDENHEVFEYIYKCRRCGKIMIRQPKKLVDVEIVKVKLEGS